jgi:hypothetical protein
MCLNITTRQRPTVVGCLGLAIFTLLVSGSGQTHQKGDKQTPLPSITITDVPPAGNGSSTITKLIGGTVTGPHLADCAVVLYAHTDTWYVQPTIADPYTAIDPKGGRWENTTHPGAEYAALLVKRSYRPDSTTDALPKVGDNVLAEDVKPGK